MPPLTDGRKITISLVSNAVVIAAWPNRDRRISPRTVFKMSFMKELMLATAMGAAFAAQVHRPL